MCRHWFRRWRNRFHCAALNISRPLEHTSIRRGHGHGEEGQRRDEKEEQRRDGRERQRRDDKEEQRRDGRERQRERNFDGKRNREIAVQLDRRRQTAALSLHPIYLLSSAHQISQSNSRNLAIHPAIQEGKRDHPKIASVEGNRVEMRSLCVTALLSLLQRLCNEFMEGEWLEDEGEMEAEDVGETKMEDVGDTEMRDEEERTREGDRRMKDEGESKIDDVGELEMNDEGERMTESEGKTKIEEKDSNRHSPRRGEDSPRSTTSTSCPSSHSTKSQSVKWSRRMMEYKRKYAALLHLAKIAFQAQSLSIRQCYSRMLLLYRAFNPQSFQRLGEFLFIERAISFRYYGELVKRTGELIQPAGYVAASNHAFWKEELGFNEGNVCETIQILLFHTFGDDLSRAGPDYLLQRINRCCNDKRSSLLLHF